MTAASGGAGAATGGKSGTGGAGTGGSNVVSTPCDAPTKVLLPKCGTAGCHVPNVFPPDISTAKMAAALVGASQGATTCAADATSPIVSATAPLSGTLFLWITGSTCREQMPFGGTPLSADEIACVKSYFTSLIK